MGGKGKARCLEDWRGSEHWGGRNPSSQVGEALGDQCVGLGTDRRELSGDLVSFWAEDPDLQGRGGLVPRCWVLQTWVAAASPEGEEYQGVLIAQVGAILRGHSGRRLWLRGLLGNGQEVTQAQALTLTPPRPPLAGVCSAARAAERGRREGAGRVRLRGGP